MTDDLARALGEVLAGAPVSDLHRLSGGASRETWSFSADGVPLILQRTRPGSSLGGPTMATEDLLLAAAGAAGVPVPPTVVGAAACEASLGPARITAFVDGETIGPRIIRSHDLAEARSRLTGQAGRALAAIHAIDADAVPGLEMVEPLERLRIGLDLVEEARPTFELALRWLGEHRPAPLAAGPSVVHGDFRVGNLLVDETGLRAVLDWELAHLGDPAEDLAWFCLRAWRFGGPGEAGGVGSLDDLLTAYRAAGGSRSVDEERVRWWMVVGTLTWGLICAVQARRHLDGHVRSLELATIGRRVCECEYDLLDLLGIGGHASADRPASSAGPDPDPVDIHGRPTLEELVDALAARDEGDAFQAKVAAHAQAIVDRERELGPDIARRAARSLASIGCATESDLAATVRADGFVLTDSVADVIRSLATDRLRVANPSWLLPPDHA